MTHRYRLRELVRFASVSRFVASDHREVFEVVRLLPEDGNGEPTYRIKSSSSERAVRESEIAPLS